MGILLPKSFFCLCQSHKRNYYTYTIKFFSFLYTTLLKIPFRGKRPTTMLSSNFYSLCFFLTCLSLSWVGGGTEVYKIYAILTDINDERI